MQAGWTTIKLDVLFCLHVKDNHLLKATTLPELLTVWATAAKNDKIALESAACVAKSALEVVQLDVLLEHAPDEVYRVDGANVVEHVGSCAAVRYELLAYRKDVHVDPATRLLSSRVGLLLDVHSLKMVSGTKNVDGLLNNLGLSSQFKLRCCWRHSGSSSS